MRWTAADATEGSLLVGDGLLRDRGLPGRRRLATGRRRRDRVAVVDVVTLKELMGYARIETTLVYLRRLNRRQAMETVRDLTDELSPGQLHHTSVAPHHNYRGPQIAAKTLESLPVTEKEGFEPSLPDKTHEQTAGSQQGEFGPRTPAPEVGKEGGIP